MPKGTAIHIGLDNVDPSAYEGWDGALAACENDAMAMEELTGQLGFGTRTLLSKDATAEAVFTAMRDAAAALCNGDICVITYAGHGGQFADLSGDEEDRRDETWLLYNREVLDDEIRVALSAFKAGVRVVVLSDSCHSGTVVRHAYEQLIETPAIRTAYERAAPWLRSRSGIASRKLRLRGAPQEIQERVLAAHRIQYQRVKRSISTRDETTIVASVILMSGCQDNQESAEENGHGVFTAALLDHWERGTFVGDYAALHAAIQRDLPPTQSPNLFTIGYPWRAFERQVPFTIDPPDATVVDEADYPAQDPESNGTPSLQVITTEASVVVVKFRDH